MFGEIVLIGAVSLGLSILLRVATAVERRTGNGGWVDAIWTFSLGGAGVAYGLIQPNGSDTPARGWLVAAMAAAWALRLGLHIVRRSIGHKDPRYAKLREEWGADYPKRMGRFLQMQALAAAALAMTMWLAARNPAPGLGVIDVAGVLVFALAVVGGAIADAQLTAFKANPANKGRVCDVGLWAWSRHPNYFFEWMVWLGFAILAVNTAGDWPWGWAAFVAPAFMMWLLLTRSGVPPLEAHMARTRGQAWEDYKARTSVFIPLPPRRGAQTSKA